MRHKLFFLFALAVIAAPSMVQAQAGVASEQETCQQRDLQTGTRGVTNPDTCYGGFADASSGTNGVSCVAATQACCKDTSGTPSCYDRTGNFTPAAPSSTAVTPSSGTSTTTKTPTNPVTFKPEIPLPNFVGGPIDSQTLGNYVRAIFVYFIWSVGILAVVMVVYGGIKWIAAAGNTGRINDARDMINNAIIGLIIALTSVVLLTIINPRLANLPGIHLEYIDQEELSFDDSLPEEIPVSPGLPAPKSSANCRTELGPIGKESRCGAGNIRMTWPVNGQPTTIKDYVGPRSGSVGSSCHRGTDFSTNKQLNQRLVAMHAGILKKEGTVCNENVLRVVSADGYYTRYVHVAAIVGSVNRTVSAGELIGYSGGDKAKSGINPRTGRACSGGPHAHVELYDRNGIVRDVTACLDL